jgi:O-antigen/teichoic acid export membrane protein
VAFDHDEGVAIHDAPSTTRLARAGIVQASAAMTAIVSNGLLGLLLARALVPSSFAAWTLFIALLGYANHAHVGLIFGAQQIIPTISGPRLNRRARALHDTAWASLMVPSIAYAIGGGAVWCATTSCDGWGVGAIVCVAFLCQPVLVFAQASLRLMSEFTRMSAIAFVAYAMPGIAIVALVIAGASVTTTLAATLVASAGVLGCVLGTRWIGLPRVIDLAVVGQLFVHGIAPSAGAILSLLVLNADVWIIQTRGDRSDLGFWGIGLSLASMSLSAIASFANVLYPTIVREYGLRDENMPLRRWLIPLGLIGGLGLIAMGALARPVLELLLPRYVPAAAVAVALAGTGVELGIASFSLNVLLAQRRYVLVIACLVPIVVGSIISDLVLVEAPLVVIAMTKTTIVGIGMIAASFIASRRHRGIGLSWTIGVGVLAAVVIGVALASS